MSQARRRLSPALALGGAGLAALAIAAATAPAVAGDADALTWAPSFDAARSQARVEGKLICVFFYDAGSGTSRRFGDSVLASSEAQAKLEKFVLCRIEKKSRHRLIRERKVQLWPSVWFFVPDGRPIKGINGKVAKRVFLAQVDEVLARFARPAPRPATRPKLPPLLTGGKEKDPAPKAFPHLATCPGRCGSCDAAIARGMRWLLKRQRRDGSWQRDKIHDDPRRLSSLDFISTALTATAGLAILSTGKDADDPKAAEAVERAARWLRREIRKDGVVSQHPENDDVYQIYAYYQTPLAALFLAELLERDDDPRLRSDLERVASAIAAGQGGDGGWGYGLNWRAHPRNETKGWTLTSTTATCVTALLRLRELGVPVDDAVIGRGFGYLEKAAVRDGYGYSHIRGYAPYPAAGAQVAIPFSLAAPLPAPAGGDTRGPHAARARRAMRRSLTRLGTTLGTTDAPSVGKYETYGRIWTGWAMAREGRRGGVIWHRFIRDYIVGEQGEDGAWPDPMERGGDIYVTAANLIALSAVEARLAITRPMAAPAMPTLPTAPRYVATGVKESQLKVFEVDPATAGGVRYGIDLTVSCDRGVGDAYRRAIGEAVASAGGFLHDITDGQMVVRRITVHGERDRWEKADIRFSTKDYWSAHGMTVRQREVKGGEVEDAVGLYIECPLKLPWVGAEWKESGGGWTSSGGSAVIAHELAHYVFALKDEYTWGTGEPRCRPCILAGAGRGDTELCTDATHEDGTLATSCWRRAAKQWPRLAAPKGRPDPGPFQAPKPEIVIAP